MVKFSAIIALKLAAQRLLDALWWLWQKALQASEYIWGQLKLRTPFIRAVITRHTNNPATIFIDVAVVILTLYLVFGAIGGVLIYKNKDDSRFTEVLSVLYPLPAARVDNAVIWSHKYLQRLRFFNTLETQNSAALPDKTALKKQVLAGLIENRIIFEEAKKLGVKVSAEELAAAVDKQRGQTQNFEQEIQRLYRMSINEFNEIIAEIILKEKVKLAVVKSVKVNHVLTDTSSAANSAKRSIESGASFEDAAKEYSQDEKTKNNGGYLGEWTKGELEAQISAEFEKIAFESELNSLIGPVNSKFGYHIIKVTERSNNEYITYSEWFERVVKSYYIKRYINI